MLVVWAGNYIELRIDDAVGAVASPRRRLLRGFLVGIFAGGYPTGLDNVESSMGGQLMGMMVLPLAFIPGYSIAWLLKKFNLLRVPPEVELEGLDLAEFGQDFYPEFERVPEVVIEPDGREVDGAPVLLDAYWQTNGKPTTPVGAGSRKGAGRCSMPSVDEWSEDIAGFWTYGPEGSTGTWFSPCSVSPSC